MLISVGLGFGMGTSLGAVDTYLGGAGMHGVCFGMGDVFGGLGIHICVGDP